VLSGGDTQYNLLERVASSYQAMLDKVRYYVRANQLREQEEIMKTMSS
jgi:hypothetical protein